MIWRSVTVNLVWRTAAVAASALGLIGCGRDEVGEYRVPKETPSAARQALVSPQAQEPTIPTWTVPAGWTDRGASGMRVGSFAIGAAGGPSADVSVIPLSSWSGRELENVNRWRAQVGLASVKAEELPQQLTIVEIGGAPGQLYEFAGRSAEDDQPRRILAVVLPLSGMAWFFKMAGDDALVREQKPAFVAFLKSVKRGGSEAAAADTQPTSTPPAAPANDSLGKPEAAKPAWTVPAGWKQEAPASVQLARFSSANPDGSKAEVTVTVLMGEGGGALANVNRWRAQLGLSPLDEAGLAKLATSIETSAGAATVVDLVSDSKEKRIVAARAAREGQTWFYRLSGSDAAVAAQKEAFLKFVQSAR